MEMRYTNSFETDVMLFTGEDSKDWWVMTANFQTVD
jgi:hypothetical protein